MRIVLVHQFYLRPGEGGGSRFNEMVRWWQARGHEVRVIAGQVSYTSGDRAQDLGVLHEEDGEHGERVYRVYTPGTYQKGVLGRAWSVGGFALGAMGVFARECLRWADVVVVTSPPLTVGVFPLWIKVLSGWRLPVAFEVRDLWPESAVATGALAEGSAMTRALYGLEALAYRVSDVVVPLTPAIARSIVTRELKDAASVIEIPNGADEYMLEPVVNGGAREQLREEYGWGDKFVVLYAGAHGVANDLVQVLDAAQAAMDAHLGDEILWVLVGDGPQKRFLKKESEDRGLSNVEWRASVGRVEVKRLFDAADCGVAVLKRTETFKTVYPNKIFDTMSRGRPVCFGVDGVARELIEGAGAGLFFEPGDGEDFFRQVNYLRSHPEEAQHMGVLGRELVQARFSRRMLALEYLDVLGALVGGVL